MHFTILKCKEKLIRAKAMTKFETNSLDFLKTLITLLFAFSDATVLKLYIAPKEPVMRIPNLLTSTNGSGSQDHVHF